MYPTLIDHLLVLLLGLVLPFFSGIRGHEKMQSLHFDAYSRRRFFLTNSLMLGIMAGVVLLAWRWNSRNFADMGFRLPAPSAAAKWLVALTICLHLSDLIFGLFHAHRLKKRGAGPEASIPFLPESYHELPSYIIMCLSAAIFEEIMFRGFMVTYFVDPYSTVIPWMAIIFPAILFSIAHYYQGYLAIFKIFLLSLLFGLIFLYSGSLLYVMLIHFFIDLIGGLAGIRFLRK